MGDQFWATVSGTIALIVGLAVIAVVLSPRATTSQVAGTTFTGLEGLIKAATEPVSGGGIGGFSAMPQFGSLQAYG